MLKITSNPGEEQTHLFYDERSGQYFESTYYKVQLAEYLMNRNLMMGCDVYLNDWYDELDIDIVEDGYVLGWSQCMLMDYYWQPWLDFNRKKITTEEGKECISISFWQEPIEGFDDYY